MKPTGNEPWYSPYDSPESHEAARLAQELEDKIENAARELCRRSFGREFYELTPAWKAALIDDARGILEAAGAI